MAKKNKKMSTRDRIIQVANHLFFEEGYTATTASRIAKEVGISTGNLTFHFPTKEHMLLELVKVLCSFQWDLTLRAAKEIGFSPLLAYGLEITLQTTVCENSGIAREFYVSAYTHPLTLAEIREWDTRKAQELFGVYNPAWTETDFRLVEELASGIEVAVLMSPCEDKVTLDEKIACTLHNLMRMYNVPDEESDEVIRKILAMDYPRIADDLLLLYREYIDAAEEFKDAPVSYKDLITAGGAAE